MHEILESDDLDKALTDCEQKPAALFSANINDNAPPNFNTLVQPPYEAAAETEFRG